MDTTTWMWIHNVLIRTTNIRFFKRKLNQVRHLKENLLDQSKDRLLGIKDGFMDTIFLVTHLGVGSLIAGQAFGMKTKYGIGSIN